MSKENADYLFFVQLYAAGTNVAHSVLPVLA